MSDPGSSAGSSSSSPSSQGEASTSTSPLPQEATRSEIFHSTLTGERAAPLLPRLSSDLSPLSQPLVKSLPAYIALEGGAARRESRLRALWEKLPRSASAGASPAPMELNLASKDVAGNPTGVAGRSTRANIEAYGLTPERASKLRDLYLVELAARCKGDFTTPESSSDKPRAVDWEGFKRYADEKEKELWNIFHNELDLDGNGHLDSSEWSAALAKAGINLTPRTLSEFMTFLNSSPHSRAISFPEFRDFLLLMPRKASTAEIFRYYEVRKSMDQDGRGASRVNMEGDVSLSAEDRPAASSSKVPSHAPLQAPESLPALPGAPDEFPDYPEPTPSSLSGLVHDSSLTPSTPVDHSPYLVTAQGDDDEEDDDYVDDDHEAPLHLLGGKTAVKFLLAGGIAGVVSRTATAPFDRLKVFLITTTPENGNGPPGAGAFSGSGPAKSSSGEVLSTAQAAQRNSRAIGRAIMSLYEGGGVRSFWVGNGLNTIKILPESAIKFMSYETSKRFFAKYYDHVEDSRDISGISRFISGGIGGMTSQLAIYPIETLKTQMMSTKGRPTRALIPSAQQVWALGGMRAFYRGLVIGLVGVFPYSAIDMSTFEALKLAYARSTGNPEPSVLAMLAFGSVSGSVGATSVYPLNLIRTRLQASGSSGHPQRYSGMGDVVRITYNREGWKGFYKGLVPTLAKVVPAVSISYVVYEKSKHALGVA